MHFVTNYVVWATFIFFEGRGEGGWLRIHRRYFFEFFLA